MILDNLRQCSGELWPALLILQAPGRLGIPTLKVFYGQP